MMKIDENNNIDFVSEAADKCELCGDVAELRPYGPNRERICHPCGMKDMETTIRMMNTTIDEQLAANGKKFSDVKSISANGDPNPDDEILGVIAILK